MKEPILLFIGNRYWTFGIRKKKSSIFIFLTIIYNYYNTLKLIII